MIARAANIEKKILDIKYGRIKEGLKIDIPEMDEYLRFKHGNFNLLIGHANVGKTTVLTYLFTVWAIKHDLKFLIWSSENTPQSIVRKIIEFKMGQPIQKASEEQIAEAIKWCDNHFKVIDVQDLITYKELLKEVNDIKDAWDYDALMIDPYNSLSIDKQLMRSVGGHQYDYQVASEFRLFSKGRNVALFLNAHGVTDAMRQVYPQNHEYAGLPKPLSMSQVEGGGKWGNRADDCYCVHRMTNHPNEWMYSELHVLKIKETETGGRCTPYEQPMKLRMSKNNVGFEFLNRNILHSKHTDINEIINF